MSELSHMLHPAELALLRSRRNLAPHAANMLTFAVVCGLTTATAIMVAALAGNL